MATNWQVKQRAFVHVGHEKITMGCPKPSARKLN